MAIQTREEWEAQQGTQTATETGNYLIEITYGGKPIFSIDARLVLIGVALYYFTRGR